MVEGRWPNLMQGGHLFLLMILSTWNIRSMNESLKCVEVRKYLNQHSIQVCGLLETRVRCQNITKVSKRFGSQWSWVHSYTFSPKGRIWVGWLSSEISVDIIEIAEQLIHLKITSKQNLMVFYCTVVYGLHTVEDRKSLWVQLMNLADELKDVPWIISGDFNVVLSSEDRINWVPVSDHETFDFEIFQNNAECMVMQTKGSYHTWSNKATGIRVWSKLDWMLHNVKFLDVFPGGECLTLLHGISDHSPFKLDLGSCVLGEGRPFKFLNYVAEHSQFLPILKEEMSHKHHSSATRDLWQSLKAVKMKLKQLHKEEFANTTIRIEDTRSQLADIQLALSSDCDNSYLQLQEKECIVNLRKWLKVEERALKQKSRNLWLNTGDTNHYYFFSVMKERFATNKIYCIYNEQGQRLTAPDEVKNEISNLWVLLLLLSQLLTSLCLGRELSFRIVYDKA